MPSDSITRSAWSVKSNGPSPTARLARNAGTSERFTRPGFVREVWSIVPPVRSIERTAAGSSRRTQPRSDSASPGTWCSSAAQPRRRPTTS